MKKKGVEQIGTIETIRKSGHLHFKAEIRKVEHPFAIEGDIALKLEAPYITLPHRKIDCGCLIGPLSSKSRSGYLMSTVIFPSRRKLREKPKQMAEFLKREGVNSEEIKKFTDKRVVDEIVKKQVFENLKRWVDKILDVYFKELKLPKEVFRVVKTNLKTPKRAKKEFVKFQKELIIQHFEALYEHPEFKKRFSSPQVFSILFEPETQNLSAFLVVPKKGDFKHYPPHELKTIWDFLTLKDIDKKELKDVLPTVTIHVFLSVLSHLLEVRKKGQAVKVKA